MDIKSGGKFDEELDIFACFLMCYPTDCLLVAREKIHCIYTVEKLDSTLTRRSKLRSPLKDIEVMCLQMSCPEKDT